MALLRSGSYGHHIQKLGGDTYRITWTVDRKYGRIRFPRLHSRITDCKGAVLFAKRWDIAVPTGVPKFEAYATLSGPPKPEPAQSRPDDADPLEYPARGGRDD